MVSSAAKTVAEYLEQLPPERRQVIATVRKVIRKNLPRGYRETMSCGVIAYEVPLKVCPDTYNGQPLAYAALAAQKNYYAVYLSCVYGDSDSANWFRKRYLATGKRLDMGKSCVRFRKLDDLPLELIGEAIARMPIDKFVAFYQKYHAERKGK
jgi:hypothetical protein